MSSHAGALESKIMRLRGIVKAGVWSNELSSFIVHRRSTSAPSRLYSKPLALMWMVSWIILLVASGIPVQAQSEAPGWTPPINLFETEGRASEAEVIADPFGVVHVFWAYGAPNAEDEGSAQAIYYTQLQNSSWSKPVDVLISPGGRVARMPAVAVDADGYLHVVWSGSNAIFYSRAYAPEAGSASGWTSPEALISGVGALEPAIAVGPDKTLYVVWSQTNAGLVFMRSDDGGHTWSEPQSIFTAEGNNELARWGRIAVDDTGRLHVVFTYTVNDPERRYGRPDANLLYYLQSDDRGATWSEPFRVTREPDFGEINVATFGQNTVHLVWNGRAGRNGRYHRWSEDGGKTWSDIVEVLPPAPQSPIGDGGLTGFPALAMDASGALHMVSATGGGDYYFRWANGVWSSPVLISPGIKGDGVTRTNNSLEQPSAAIGQGNQLHIVFHDGFERIWYTGRRIDAAYQPPRPAPPAPAAPLTATAALAANPSVSASTGSPPTPTLPPTAQAAPPANSSPFIPILIGILPAVVLVGFVVLVYRTRRSR